MKQYFLIITLFGLLVLPGTLGAEENSSVADKKYLPPADYKQEGEKRPLPPIRTERKDDRGETTAELKQKQEQALQALKEKRDSNQTITKEKRDAFFEEAKENRDAFRDQRKSSTDDMNERRAALEAQIKAKREALKTQITEIKKERVTARKVFVETRFSEVIKMLATAQERVGAKIDELEGKDYDMTDAQMHLDESKDSLTEAKALFATLSSMTVSDTDESTATKPRETAKKIEELLKTSREHLREAIEAMKKAVNPPDDASTDSPSDN